MRPIALLLVAALPAACLADVTNDEPTGDAAEPGLSWGTSARDHSTPGEKADAWLHEHRGEPCADACYEVWVGVCPWRDDCRENPYDEVHCAGKALTCTETANAADSVGGMSWCYRSCEGLR